MVDNTSRTSFDTNGELCEALTAAIDPLTSTTPDAPIGDLDVIGEAIADADVVGMGEASHGTREFFQFKHRLFRYLVEEHDVRMLGLEANFAAMLDINDYVVRGEGTAEAGLSQDCIHRPYQNESILELVEWIREFNAGRPPAKKIRFHGFDVQFPPVAAAKLETYFETVAPDVLADVQTDLDRLIEHGFPDISDDEALHAHLAAREAVVATLREAMNEHETTYIDTTSRKEFERANRLVWMLAQGQKQFEVFSRRQADIASSIRIRDRAMAAQVQWLLKHAPADRMALWGHNAHLTHGAFSASPAMHEQEIPSLGKHLTSVADVDYYALGLLLGGGTVRTFHGPGPEFGAYEITKAPEGSVPDVFSRLDVPLFFLDVAGLPADSILTEWADSEPLRYVLGDGSGDTPVNLVELDFRQQFDGLIFIRETTAAQLVATETRATNG